jgi:predicted O-methyltransferase YrrM
MARAATFEHLRLVKASALYEYRLNTRLFQHIGNSAFADRIAREPRSLSHENGLVPPGTPPYVLYHSWKKGYVELSAREATSMRKLMRTPPSRAPASAYARDLGALGWCDLGEPPVRSLVERCTDRFHAIQNERELGVFLRLVARARPRVVVELGTARGGVFYCLSQLAHPEALLVSVDLPGGPNCGGQTEVERRVFRSFARPAQRMTFIPRNSQLASTQQALRRAVGGRPIDLLFIDADHSYAGVRADFEAYSGLVRPGGMIVLHDIVGHEATWGSYFGVGDLWDEVKSRYRSKEIFDPDGCRSPAMPEGEKMAWGIGVLWTPPARGAGG